MRLSRVEWPDDCLTAGGGEYARACFRGDGAVAGIFAGGGDEDVGGGGRGGDEKEAVARRRGAWRGDGC